MHVDTRLTRGDRIQPHPDSDWPDVPPPVYELLCDPAIVPVRSEPDQSEPWWSMHIRYASVPPDCRYAAAGDETYVLVQLRDIDYVARAANPDRACTGEYCHR